MHLPQMSLNYCGGRKPFLEPSLPSLPIPCEVKNYNQWLMGVGGAARREKIHWPHILPNFRPLKVYQIGRNVILKLNEVQTLLFLHFNWWDETACVTSSDWRTLSKIDWQSYDLPEKPNRGRQEIKQLSQDGFKWVISTFTPIDEHNAFEVCGVCVCVCT